jgi:hypothetical protein
MPTRVPIVCPECQKTLRVRTEYIGRAVRCNHCDRSFSVPRKFGMACPSCGVRESVRIEDLGRVIRCNRCDAVHEVIFGADGQSPGHPREIPGETARRCVASDARRIVDLNSREINRDRADRGRGHEASNGVDRPVSGVGAETGPVGRAGAFGPGPDATPRSGPGAARANGESPPHGRHPVAVEHVRNEMALQAELEEARSQLDRLRCEVDALRLRACEAERLAVESADLRWLADERSRRQAELRIELEGARAELQRLTSETAGLRDRAASAGRLEDELQAAREEATKPTAGRPWPPPRPPRASLRPSSSMLRASRTDSIGAWPTSRPGRRRRRSIGRRRSGSGHEPPSWRGSWRG